MEHPMLGFVLGRVANAKYVLLISSCASLVYKPSDVTFQNRKGVWRLTRVRHIRPLETCRIEALEIPSVLPSERDFTEYSVVS